MHGVHPEFFSEQRLKYSGANFGIGRRHLLRN